MVEEDMDVLSSNGSVLSAPLATSYPRKPPQYSDCAPMFLKVQLNHHCHVSCFEFWGLRNLLC